MMPSGRHRETYLLAALIAAWAVGSYAFTQHPDKSVTLTQDETVKLKAQISDLQDENIALVFQVDSLIKALKSEQSKACI